MLQKLTQLTILQFGRLVRRVQVWQERYRRYSRRSQLTNMERLRYVVQNPVRLPEEGSVYQNIYGSQRPARPKK